MEKRFKETLIPKKVVIKLGTSSLTHPSGLINLEKVENLVRQIIDLKNKGSEVIVVSSGAIGAGMGKLKVDKSTASIAQKQALAAVGQNILMHIYLKFAEEYGASVGQILLSKEDIDDKKRGAHSKDAILALLDYDIIPIVNENDAIAVDEIKVGDNDTLSAMVAKLIEADWLVILTDIDGLYSDNPKTNKNAVLIDHVKELTLEHKNSAKGSSSNLGTGGMETKLHAVEIANKVNIQTVIANSNEKHVLTRIFKGEKLGTWFES